MGDTGGDTGADTGADTEGAALGKSVGDGVALEPHAAKRPANEADSSTVIQTRFSMGSSVERTGTTNSPCRARRARSGGMERLVQSAP